MSRKKRIVLVIVEIIAVLLVVILIAKHFSNTPDVKDAEEATAITKTSQITESELEDNRKLAKHIKKGHSVKKNILKATTCTEDGEVKYTCDDCGFTDTVKIKAPGHTEVKDAAKEPTCQHTGLTEGSHCSVCGEVMVKRESLPVVDHKYNKEGICVWCGIKKGDKSDNGSGSGSSKDADELIDQPELGEDELPLQTVD